ncbi:hypothetical protein MQW34_28000 (plasmid) [Bacillus sp. ZJS3]|uniref:hypothetical protein n=1 Tax=Bacillus sp. ZJS3 TaxID=2928154 RepID=UPI001FB2A6DC|nr:hypothetical protein [Bacillus sp. ZJS3]UOB81995.1 hypothetical protein MQW34_28000 [Bacillus sp. ZJS3]
MQGKVVGSIQLNGKKYLLLEGNQQANARFWKEIGETLGEWVGGDTGSDIGGAIGTIVDII